MSSRWIDASEGRSKHNCKWSDEITTYQEKEKQLHSVTAADIDSTIQNTMMLRQWLNILITLHYIYLCSDRCIIALSAMIILCAVSITWQHRDHIRLTGGRCGVSSQSEVQSVSIWPMRRQHRASGVWPSEVRAERTSVPTFVDCFYTWGPKNNLSMSTNQRKKLLPSNQWHAATNVSAPFLTGLK